MAELFLNSNVLDLLAEFSSLIHKELTKLAEIAWDLSAEFRQFGTNKISSEFSRKIVAENSAKKNLSILSESVIFVWKCTVSDKNDNFFVN